MRFLTASAVLACAASAAAYTILVPNQDSGWTDQGAQPFRWSRDNTDRANFTVVLTNSDRSLMPTDQALAALVDGDLGNITLNPPSAGWPIPGPGYRLLIVDSATNLTGVLARSTAFDIEHSSAVPSSSRTSYSTTIRDTSTEQPNAQPTDDTLPDDNGSAASLKVSAALAAVLALVPALL